MKKKKVKSRKSGIIMTDMKEFTISSTKKKQVIDLTDRINRYLKEEDLESGICHLFVLHTTAALTVAELDPGTDQDLLDALEALVPDLKYRHAHDPSHVGDHIMSSIIGPDLTIPIKHGRLYLGTWQSAVLVELNGPRDRRVAITTSSR